MEYLHGILQNLLFLGQIGLWVKSGIGEGEQLVVEGVFHKGHLRHEPPGTHSIFPGDERLHHGARLQSSLHQVVHFSLQYQPGGQRHGLLRFIGLVKAHALRAQLMLLHQRPDLLLITDQHRLNQALLMGPHSGQKRMLILRHDYGHPLLSNSRTYGCKIIQ